MPTHSHLTVSPHDSDEDVTFRATIYDMGTAVSVMGPVRMVLDQISISPAGGVSLEYRRTNDYHTHLAGILVLGSDDERRLVEWLHEVGGNFVIETAERRSDSLAQASERGQCAGCGAYFKDGHEWKIHQRQEDDRDLYFCGYDCLALNREAEIQKS